jgi:short subunit dehydrogenase-like uncharacterized protein
MSGAQSWMLYGAAGHTGALIAQHARQRGHQPLLAGRSVPAVAALAGRLDLPYRALALDDPAALPAALADMDLVLNAAGPFLHTATPLAEACLGAGVHYLDIGNELQVFRTLYGLHQRAQRAGVAIIPGAGFGVVATNCLARYVSDAAGGAQHLEVATRATTSQPGPGGAASMRENLPYGGWIRQAGHLHPHPLGSAATTITFPDGPCRIRPVPTGDLEAAFQATGAADIIAYSAELDPSARRWTPSPEGYQTTSARTTWPATTETASPSQCAMSVSTPRSCPCLPGCCRRSRCRSRSSTAATTASSRSRTRNFLTSDCAPAAL